MPHLTVAASERAFRESFNVLRDSLRWEDSGDTDFGPFRAGYHIAGHLEGGEVDLRADNTLDVSELDIRWDRFEFSLGLDIPEICVGGGCINMPWPIPDLCLPEYCLFEDDPDVEISVDLSPFVAQEVSFRGGLEVRPYDGSIPPPLFDPCQFVKDLLVNENVIPAFPPGKQWHLFVIPETVDIDLFDFSDIVADLIEDALVTAVTALIPGGWVRDLLLALVGGIVDLIRWALDLPDDIEEWLSDVFNTSFGIIDKLIELVGEFLGNCVPIYRIDDPLEIMPATVSTSVSLDQAPVPLVNVALPIADLSVRINTSEMVVTADVGA